MTMRIGPPTLPPRAELFISAPRPRKSAGTAAAPMPIVTLYGTPAALAALGHSLIALAEEDSGSGESILLIRPDDPAFGLLPGSRGFSAYRRKAGNVRP